MNRAKRRYAALVGRLLLIVVSVKAVQCRSPRPLIG
jgi:hypothetical protein